MSSFGIVNKDEIIFYTIDFEELLMFERSNIFKGDLNNSIFITNFMFNLIPYNGDPDLYIHYGEVRPKSIEKFDWKSEASFQQDIILITAEELNKKIYSLSSKLFIAIKGKDVSAF